ncbi:hypothetical protein PSA5_26670 [Pseudomonas syringae pv. actinidiae]|nr:hypothetical protein PSA5_26670 [Pseudomonas syringae pv. actinidiae]
MGWNKIAEGQAMSQAVKSGNTDAVAAVSQVEKQGGNDGITWVGGNKAGGSGQKPINVVGDVTRAGYNLLNGRSAADSSSISPANCNNGMVCSTWSSPQDATAFANRVLGEQQQRTCEGCTQTTSTAGVGLTPLIQEAYDSKLTALQELISGSKSLTSENLTAASSNSLPVTRGVVEALRTEQDQDILAKRLASEVALSEVLGKALMLQRTMFTGSKEPNIAANTVALNAVSQQNSKTAACNRKSTTSRPSLRYVAIWPATPLPPYSNALKTGKTVPKQSSRETLRLIASTSCKTQRKVTDHEFASGHQRMAAQNPKITAVIYMAGGADRRLGCLVYVSSCAFLWGYRAIQGMAKNALQLHVGLAALALYRDRDWLVQTAERTQTTSSRYEPTSLRPSAVRGDGNLRRSSF